MPGSAARKVIRLADRQVLVARRAAGRRHHGEPAQDLQHEFLADQDDDNGLERFITATRRQNFLVPPRRHRSFPLLELS